MAKGLEPRSVTCNREGNLHLLIIRHTVPVAVFCPLCSECHIRPRHQEALTTISRHRVIGIVLSRHHTPPSENPSRRRRLSGTHSLTAASQQTRLVSRHPSYAGDATIGVGDVILGLSSVRCVVVVLVRAIGQDISCVHLRNISRQHGCPPLRGDIVSSALYALRIGQRITRCLQRLNLCLPLVPALTPVPKGLEPRWISRDRKRDAHLASICNPVIVIVSHIHSPIGSGFIRHQRPTWVDGGAPSMEHHTIIVAVHRCGDVVQCIPWRLVSTVIEIRVTLSHKSSAGKERDLHIPLGRKYHILSRHVISLPRSSRQGAQLHAPTSKLIAIRSGSVRSHNHGLPCYQIRLVRGHARQTGNSLGNSSVVGNAVLGLSNIRIPIVV